MKAIILAAGEWTRLRPITYDVPKAMVQLWWKPLMEYNMESLIPYVSEFIIVVKYKKEKIQNYFKNSFAGIPVRYHEQGDEKGTGAAIKWISSEEDVVIVYADTIVSSEDIEKAMQEKDFTVFVKEVEEPSKYGIYLSDGNGFALEVVEKPLNYIGKLANMGFFKVHRDILEYVNEIELSPRWEYELTDAINIFLKKHKLKLICLENPITDITSLENLEEENKKITEKNIKILIKKPKFWESILLENIRGLELHFGISQKNIEELITYSGDPTDIALVENTGDVWRFSQKDKIEKWYNEEQRYIFTLVDAKWHLAGIWWGRPSLAPKITEVLNEEIYQKLEGNKNRLHTSGVRIYWKFRGQKLAIPFIRKCTYLYSSIFPWEILCVDVNEKNIPMQAVYEKTKHKKVGYGENSKSIKGSERKRLVYIKYI